VSVVVTVADDECLAANPIVPSVRSDSRSETVCDLCRVPEEILYIRKKIGKNHLFAIWRCFQNARFCVTGAGFLRFAQCLTVALNMCSANNLSFFGGLVQNLSVCWG
jgi:hypothetical protein